MSSNYPKLLFVDNQKKNEALTDYVNRIAFHNGFKTSESMIKFFFKHEGLKKEFVKLRHNFKLLNTPQLALRGVSDSQNSKPHNLNGVTFDWLDLIVFIELITNKKIFINSYPRTYIAHQHRFELTSKYRGASQKICPRCWSESNHIRFYWNFVGNDFCHFHQCSLVRLDSKNAGSIARLNDIPGQVFFNKLLSILNPDNETEVPFHEIESELTLYATELNLIKYIESPLIY